MERCCKTFKTGNCACICADIETFDTIVEVLASHGYAFDDPRDALDVHQWSDGSIQFDLTAVFQAFPEGDDHSVTAEDVLKLCLPGSQATFCAAWAHPEGRPPQAPTWTRLEANGDGTVDSRTATWQPNPFEWCQEIVAKANQEGCFVPDVCDVIENLSGADEAAAIRQGLAKASLTVQDLIDLMDRRWDNSDTWEETRAVREECLEEMGVEPPLPLGQAPDPTEGPWHSRGTACRPVDGRGSLLDCEALPAPLPGTVGSNPAMGDPFVVTDDPGELSRTAEREAKVGALEDDGAAKGAPVTAPGRPLTEDDLWDLPFGRPSVTPAVAGEADRYEAELLSEQVAKDNTAVQGMLLTFDADGGLLSCEPMCHPEEAVRDLLQPLEDAGRAVSATSPCGTALVATDAIGKAWLQQGLAKVALPWPMPEEPLQPSGDTVPWADPYRNFRKTPPFRAGT